MPAEWAKHERTIMEWPEQESMVWPDNYSEVSRGYAAVVNAILKYEPVTLIVSEATLADAKALCHPEVEFLTIDHEDAWFRDNGPTFVFDQDKKLHGINWEFNAWGERFTPFDLDNAVATKLLNQYKIDIINANLILEGGSIHVDGEGTLLTTKECLLNPNRNPHMNQEQIEAKVKELLGVETIIWLNQGLYGDETDGHVDNVACFVKPGVVAIQTCSDQNDPNYAIAQENLAILRQAQDSKGRHLEIVEIEQPPARHYRDVRLTLSYLNYYLVNDGLILPVFGDDAKATDENAIKILKQLYPERTITTVNGMELIKEGGNVHCITQQMPLAPSRQRS